MITLISEHIYLKEHDVIFNFNKLNNNNVIIIYNSFLIKNSSNIKVFTTFLKAWKHNIIKTFWSNSFGLKNIILLRLKINYLIILK